jgi:hypothetical protein
MRSTVFAALLLIALPGCRTAPIASPPVQVEPPRKPPLVKVPLGPSFRDRMQSFLTGKLPEPTSSARP